MESEPPLATSTAEMIQHRAAGECSLPTMNHIVNKEPVLTTITGDAPAPSESKTSESKTCWAEIEGVPEFDDVNLLDSEVVAYIAGSVIHRMPKNYAKWDICSSCFTQAQDPSLPTTFISNKAYKPGILKQPQSLLFELLSEFENFFRQMVVSGWLPLIGLREMLIKEFLTTHTLDADRFTCTNGHLYAMPVLRAYAAVIIFHLVKQCNRRLKLGKKDTSC